MSGELLVQLAIGFFVLVGSIGGAALAARASMRVSAASAGTEHRRVDVEEWERILKQKNIDLTDMQTRLGRAERRIKELEDREDEHHELLVVHAAWDYTAIAELRRHAQITLADPPPLWPRRVPPPTPA